MTDWKIAGDETAREFLYAEEINTNNGTKHQINDIQTTRSVKYLKIAIATALGDSEWWSDLSLAYGTEILSDDDSILSSYGIHQGETVHFTRCVAAAEDLPTYEHMPIILKNVMFQDFDGRTLMLNDIPISWTIQQLRQKLAQEKAIDTDDYRFLWGGKQLQDHKTIEDYGLGKDCTIHMVMRLMGGEIS